MQNNSARFAAILLASAILATGCNNKEGTNSGGNKQAQGKANNAAAIPAFDHVVILMLENHAYEQIIGSSQAPYINSLPRDAASALFTRSYSIEHPSLPNYLDLYAGSNQGMHDDSNPPDDPFTTPNLGRQLIDSAKSYTTYSEDLPGVGYDGDVSGAYARKHNPAVNWMGTGANQIPVTTNQPFTAFPPDFTILPTISMVVPNQDNDMHDGTITEGDKWVKDHMDAYIQWAKTHNSLFILTFDEDDGAHGNHIVTLFVGPHVLHGKYANTIDHYNLLRTLEDMYALPYAGYAATATTINFCWN